MCWSIGASAVSAAAGFGTAGYLIKKKESKLLWIPLLFFSLMEIIQVLQYLVIDNCGSSLNQVLTLLGYYHIAFQPFFINAYALYFVPKKAVQRIAPFVFLVCFVGAILSLLSVYPFEWADKCIVGKELLCGARLCSVSGSWHIAYTIPVTPFFRIPWLANANIMTIGYYFPAFVLPFIYGVWRFNIYHILVGPFLSYFLTNNPNEKAAIWCLISISYMLIALIPSVKKFLKVKKWYFWNYPIK